MSNVYQEKPNIVEVSIKDSTGTAMRFVVGKSLDQVIQIIEPDVALVKFVAKKERKPRSPNKPKNLPAPEPAKSAGEEAMDRLKKDAAPTETVWP